MLLIGDSDFAINHPYFLTFDGNAWYSERGGSRFFRIDAIPGALKLPTMRFDSIGLSNSKNVFDEGGGKVRGAACLKTDREFDL